MIAVSAGGSSNEEHILTPRAGHFLALIFLMHAYSSGTIQHLKHLTRNLVLLNITRSVPPLHLQEIVQKLLFRGGCACTASQKAESEERKHAPFFLFAQPITVNSDITVFASFQERAPRDAGTCFALLGVSGGKRTAVNRVFCRKGISHRRLDENTTGCPSLTGMVFFFFSRKLFAAPPSPPKRVIVSYLFRSL